MSIGIPYGDPHGMREYARKIRWHADAIESSVTTVGLPSPGEFRGPAAERLRARRDQFRRDARIRRDELYDLAAWLDGRAADLEREIEEARRQAAEAERRRRELLDLFRGWGR